MTVPSLRGLLRVSLLIPVLQVASCVHFEGDFPAQQTAIDRLPALAETALLRGTSWEPLPLEIRTGAQVREMEIHDDTIFIIDTDATAHAINPETGTHRWILKLDRFPTRPVAVGESTIAFLAKNHLTVATRGSGTVTLRTALEFTPSSNAALTLDTLYAGAWGNGTKLRAVSLANGWNGWYYVSGGPITSAPAVVGAGAEQVICFAAQDGAVVALPPRPADGTPPSEPVWTARTLGRNSADIVHDADHVYIASEDHALYAFHHASGGIAWKWLGSNEPLHEGPAVTDDAVYQPFGGMVAAIDRMTGTERWRFNGAERFLTRVGDRDYLKLPGSAVVVVNANTGEEMARVESPLFEFLPQNPGGNALVFSDGRNLFSLR